MRLLLTFTLILYSAMSFAGQTLAEFESDSGDVLLIHRLANNEIWGSFFITDQVSDSFSSHELMLLQVDQHQPVQLDYQKVCGGAGRGEQTVIYDFAQQNDEWQFSQSRVNDNVKSTLGELAWDAQPYQRMRSDRRPEVVDFAIQGELAADNLLVQFKQGEQVVFRYTTDAGESREARFHLHQQWW
jgi:hypothetical protein